MLAPASRSKYVPEKPFIFDKAFPGRRSRSAVAFPSTLTFGPAVAEQFPDCCPCVAAFTPDDWTLVLGKDKAPNRMEPPGSPKGEVGPVWQGLTDPVALLS